MVAGPDALERLVERGGARRNLERRAVLITANEDVVDAAVQLLPDVAVFHHERTVRREGVTETAGAGSLPGVAEADQRSGPEFRDARLRCRRSARRVWDSRSWVARRRLVGRLRGSAPISIKGV